MAAAGNIAQGDLSFGVATFNCQCRGRSRNSPMHIAKCDIVSQFWYRLAVKYLHSAIQLNHSCPHQAYSNA